MPIKFSALLLAMLSAFSSRQLLSQEAANDGYPAPPGVYGHEEILKNAQFNLGSGSPYRVIVDEANSSPPGAGLQALPEPGPMPYQQKIQQPVALPATPVEPVPAKFTTFRPDSLPDNSYPAKTGTDAPFIAQDSTISQAPTVNYPPAGFQGYPEAAEMRQHYQEASQLPFNQWGSIPVEERTDYGYETVPIDTSPQWHSNRLENYNHPGQGYQDQTMQYRYPDRMFPPATNNNWQPNNFNPGRMMDLFIGSDRNNDWMPPSNPYLQPMEQFPVPQSIYGMPSVDQPAMPHGANSQYLPARIPEEDIIYPPSYPGRY
jgi:hypothetical protein